MTDEKFADVTKIDGLDGIYIANKHKNSTVLSSNQESMITFNKGGLWHYIPGPPVDTEGKPTNCTTFTFFESHVGI